LEVEELHSLIMVQIMAFNHLLPPHITTPVINTGKSFFRIHRSIIWPP